LNPNLLIPLGLAGTIPQLAHKGRDFCLVNTTIFRKKF